MTTPNTCPPCNLNCGQGDECPARYDLGVGDRIALGVLVALSFMVIALLAVIIGQVLGWW